MDIVGQVSIVAINGYMVIVEQAGIVGMMDMVGKVGMCMVGKVGMWV